MISRFAKSGDRRNRSRINKVRPEGEAEKKDFEEKGVRTCRKRSKRSGTQAWE